jgi:uncharacterized membrane protein YtjA (UPF0391 family)
MDPADWPSGTASWASAFLVIAVLAAIFGFAGIADVPVHVSWVLLVCSAIFAAAFFGAEGKRRT